MSKNNDEALALQDEVFEDEIDELSPDEFDEDAEEQEPESQPVDDVNRLNDINSNKGISQDVDISGIFLLSDLAPHQELKKISCIDLIQNGFDDINLKSKHKIKILELKTPLTELKSKKLSDIDLSEEKYVPKDFVLDLEQIENLNNFTVPIFDIKKSKKSFKININPKNIIIGFFRVIGKNLFKYLLIFFSIIAIFLSYGYFTKYKLLSTLDDLKNIKTTNDIHEIKSQVVGFKFDFMILSVLLKPIFAGNYFFENSNVNNLENIILGGKYLSNFAIDGVNFYEGFSEILAKKGPDGIKYTQLLKNVDPLLKDMLQNLDLGIKAFSQVSDLDSPELNKIFFSKLETIKQSQTYINNLYNNKDKIDSILGDQKPKTYLIVLQNNDEIRPTGGFMGSMMFVTIYKGKVVDLQKKDIYALEYLLKPFKLKIPAPEGLDKLTQYFGLRDSNYYVDLDASSKKIKEFLDKTDYKIDGIVYVNQNMLLDFLKAYPSNPFGMIKEQLTYQNFSMITSTLVEAKVTKTSDVMSTPKQILFDFIDQYIKQLKQKGDYVGYMKLLLNSIEKKDVMLYSFSKEDNDFLTQIGLVRNPDYSEFVDYDYPVFTSISGNKSDRYMKRTFVKNVKVNVDCSISTSFKIVQEHTFGYEEQKEIKGFLNDMNLLDKVDLDYTLKIQGNQKNRQFIRVVIPKNAKITKKSGLQIYSVDKYGEVGFYLDTDLYSKSEFTFDYTIDNPGCKNYNYMLVKQSGIKTYNVDYYYNGVLQKSQDLDKNFYVK